MSDACTHLDEVADLAPNSDGREDAAPSFEPP